MNCTTGAYWLEQTEDEVPAGDQWLSAREKSRLASLHFEKRRADWLLGRWTAKRALASCVNLPADIHSLQDIELRTACSGAPEIFLFNQRAPLSVSLSHRAGIGMCVVGLSGPSFGCDLEVIESRDHSFFADFFTANEQELVNRTPPDERPLLITLLWSAKESALKALHVGLRLSTTVLELESTGTPPRLTECSNRDDHAEWSPLSLRGMGSRHFRGWWRYTNNMVRTVIFAS